jgi:hypothetical protein
MLRTSNVPSKNCRGRDRGVNFGQKKVLGVVHALSLVAPDPQTTQRLANKPDGRTLLLANN